MDACRSRVTLKEIKSKRAFDSFLPPPHTFSPSMFATRNGPAYTFYSPAAPRDSHSLVVLCRCYLTSAALLPRTKRPAAAGPLRSPLAHAAVPGSSRSGSAIASLISQLLGSEYSKTTAAYSLPSCSCKTTSESAPHHDSVSSLLVAQHSTCTAPRRSAGQQRQGTATRAQQGHRRRKSWDRAEPRLARERVRNAQPPGPLKPFVAFGRAGSLAPVFNATHSR
jgi:hypothetical protein